MEAAGAAVAFDATTRKFEVVEDLELLTGAQTGSLIEVDGRQLTVLEMCESVKDAEAICIQRTDGLSDAQLVFFDESSVDGAAVCGQADTGGYSGTPESTVGGDVIGVGDMIFAQDQELTGDLEVRELMENLLDEFARDVMRINTRYQQIRSFLVRYFGTRRDGGIVDSFDTTRPQELQIQVAEESHRPKQRPTYVGSYFDGIAVPVTDDRRAHVQPSSSTSRSNPSASASSSRSGSSLRYPFVSKGEEERIFRNCGNSASNYSQRLGKLLFADSLHLYFKDQDPKKRDWLHEAVDFRFPSEDKNSHMLKWKNCSNAINKNMREKEKEKQETDRKKLKDLNYKYVNRDAEQACLERANGDPIKYAELLAMKVFGDCRDKFFKDQDPKKKEWIRECVDSRFHIHDREKRDHRWKICAAACNKNRTKIIGPDGEEDPFPYFPAEIEQKCFEESGGIPAVYAESMSKYLFPDTPHLFFKDQDIGKRHWLHDILDRRFPTSDKIEQIAKWKSITASINKNKTSEPPPPPPPAVHKATTKDKKRRAEDPKVDKEKQPETSSPSSKRQRKEKEEPEHQSQQTAPSRRVRSSKRDGPVLYKSYPFVTAAEELECLEACNGNVNVYGKLLGKILFGDSLHLYYKDQNPDRRQWMREIVDFRFNTCEVGTPEYRQKWKNLTAAVNKNMPSR